MTGAQDASAFFEANYAEKLTSEAVDHSLLTGVGSEVEIREKTISTIRHIGIVKVKGGIEECRIWTCQRRIGFLTKKILRKLYDKRAALAERIRLAMESKEVTFIGVVPKTNRYK